MGAAEASDGKRRAGSPWQAAWLVLDPNADFIFGMIEDASDTTLEEMGERPARERGVKVVYTAVWKFFDQRGLTYKKDPSRQRARAP